MRQVYEVRYGVLYLSMLQKSGLSEKMLLA